MSDDTRKDAEEIRLLKRASMGLPLDPDELMGFLDADRLDERTKLTRRDIFRMDYLEALHKFEPTLFKQAGEWAESEMHKFISEDAERVMAFIATRAQQKQEMEPSLATVNVNTPQPQANLEKKKGHWYSRGNKNEQQQKGL